MISLKRTSWPLIARTVPNDIPMLPLPIIDIFKIPSLRIPLN
jgi:hypothetical protein